MSTHSKWTAYSKWTARVAFIALVATFTLGVAFTPISSGHHQTIWPLSRHFGSHHAIADGELLISYIIIGVIAVIGTCVGMHKLAVRAEWAGKRNKRRR